LINTFENTYHQQKVFTMTKLTKSEAGQLGHLASKMIQQENKQHRIDLYNSNPTVCKHCETPLSYEDNILKKKFCNSSCSGTHTNLNRSRVSKWKGQLCHGCGEEIIGADCRRTFCSNACQGIHTNKMYIEQWFDGKISGLVEGAIDGITKKYIRKYLIDQAGHKCSECGWDKVHSVTGVVPLEIDHIDGDHNNNRPENMRVLCPNCHSLTPTYRALNMGNGRKGRIGAGGESRTPV
jgi:hypothetical protein